MQFYLLILHLFSVAVLIALGSIVLILLNALGKYSSGLGRMLPFVAGGLAIISCIIWLVMFLLEVVLVQV